MLDLAAVDLDDLCTALEDHSYETSWWLDPKTGEIRPHIPDLDEDSPDELEARGFLYIEPIKSSDGYEDMADFVSGIADRRARERLERAIEGRGAFRRFKDALFEFSELRDLWFSFHDARMRRRAVWWLAENDLISEEVAEAAEQEYPDPPLPAPETEPAELAAAVATDLRELYGSRLIDVVMFGSRARDDGDPESDLDLLVVLDEVESPWDELRRMDEVLWLHTEASGITVSAIPVTAADLDNPTAPVLIRAMRDAQPVG
jgi:predicted nucleotidyltransferase